LFVFASFEDSPANRRSPTCEWVAGYTRIYTIHTAATVINPLTSLLGNLLSASSRQRYAVANEIAAHSALRPDLPFNGRFVEPALRLVMEMTSLLGFDPPDLFVEELEKAWFFRQLLNSL
jgi:hypothetical protein